MSSAALFVLLLPIGHLLILAASQIVAPRTVLAPPPPRSSTIPLLDQLLEGSPAPPGPPRTATPLRSPPSPAPGTTPRVGFDSSSLSRGGAVVLELTRHAGRLTLFDDLLTRPHVAPILATAAMPALAPQPVATLQQLPLKVAATGGYSGGGAKAALAHMFTIPAAGGGGGGVWTSDEARRPHAVSFATSLALPADANDGEDEGGLQLSTVRPLDALGRRLPLPRSLQQSQAQPQASKSTPVAVAVPGVTVVLDGSSLAAEDPSGSLFADVLAAAGLALPAPVAAATAPPATTAAVADESARRGSSSDLRGLASAVSLRVATATAAFVQPGTAAVGAVGHATAHAMGAAVHAVGSAASSMGSAAAAASHLLAGSLRGTAAAAAAVDLRHATPARRATTSTAQQLPGNGGGVATVAGGVRLPPWLAGNPDVVVSPSGSVTIVRREERMARMRASDAPQQLQLLPSERIVAGHSHTTTGASSAVSEDTTHHHPAAGAAALRSRDGRRAAGGGSIRGSISDGPPHPSRRLSAISSGDGADAAGSRTWVEEEGEDGLGEPIGARIPFGSSADSQCEEEEDLNHVVLPSGDFMSAVDSAQGVALLLGDGDGGEGGVAQRGVADGGGTPCPGSAYVDERAAAARAPAHSFGRSSLADPRQYPPVNEVDLCAALRACCDEEAAAAAARAAATSAATAPAAAHGEAPLSIPLIGGAADAQLYLRYAALARTAGLAPSVLGSSERGAAAPPAAAVAATAAPSERVATRDGHEPPGRGGASQPRRWSNADGRSKAAAATQHAAAHAGAAAGRGARASAAAAAEAAASAGGRVHILTQPDQVALFRRHIHGHRPPPSSSDLDASARWQGEWGVAHRLLSGPHTGMPCGWLAYPLTASATATAASAHLPLYRRYLDADVALAPVEPVPCLVLHATPPPLPMVASPAS